MSYEEFLDLLQRLVDDGEITEAQAEILATQYDEFADFDLALSPEEMESSLGDVEAIVVAIVLFLLYNVLQATVSRTSLSSTLSRLSYAQRVSAFGIAQDAFQADVTELAEELVSGNINVAQWQIQFNRAIATYYRAAAQAGFGATDLSTQAENTLRLEILRQQAFLSRFADQYSLSILNGEPFSLGYMQERSRMYAGGLRAVAYRIAELSYGESEGWVAYYIAVDDDRTCSECTQAMMDGPYRIGFGPYPGEVCLGRGRCRCRREVIYDPVAYSQIGT